MNQYDLSNYNLQTKISLPAIAILSLVCFSFAFLELFSFTPVNAAVFGIFAVITAIVSQQQAKILRYKLPVSLDKVLVFWAVIWLGAAGGVFLTLISSAAAYKLFRKDKETWLISLLGGIIAAFVSAKTFYWSLALAGAAFDHNGFASATSPGLLMTAFLSMASLSLAIDILLMTIFLVCFSRKSLVKILTNAAKAYFPKYAVGLVGGLLLHFAFASFGVWFGLFLLPIAISAHLAHRVYLQRLEQKTREISEASRIHLATVEALATAIDARDQVGIGHVRRTQLYAVGIGEVMGLSADEINALRTGALLHDIGKLGVPDHILNKPGRLTPAEMEKMKIHANVGASILEKVKFPYPVVPTVKYHHEYWDGSGYPEGLKKEEIPLTARIITVADAYDTLRGARPFRNPVSRDEARRFLLSGAGSKFDPKVVDFFLQHLKRFEIEIEEQGLSYEFDLETSELYLGVEGATDANQSYVEQIKRANREVFALYELAKVFSASLNVKDTLSLFVKKVGELMPFETCAVYLLDKSQETAKIAHVEGLNGKILQGKRIKLGEGATGFVLKKRQSVYNINPALDFSFDNLESVQDYTAMASMPLIAEETLIGAISLYSCELEAYEDEHMRLLETVSRIASDAISKSLHHAETATHALTDPMTNLPNPRSLQIHFDNETARANRNAATFQLIMLDLDGFKKVNDTYGHKAGDLLLKELSKVMRAQLREYDFLARYAGDEFVAIIPDTTSQAVFELCERMEKAVLDFKLPVGEGEFASVGVSIGSACYPDDGETLDQVIISADQKMYSVKAQHKKVRDSNLKPVEENEPQPGAQPQSIAQPIEISEDSFVMELDESHIVSTAIN